MADDLTAQRLLNRSFMVDPWDRLYRDSVLVRFEDGKLNPKATFTALAEFLGPPLHPEHDLLLRRPAASTRNPWPEMPAALTRPRCIVTTDDEFANDDERAFLEYFLRDVYEYLWL